MGTKVCTCCGIEKPLSEFYSITAYQKSSVCKACVVYNKRQTDYKDKMNPDDYEKWCKENDPKNNQNPVVKEVDIKETYMYRNLSRFGNCYVRDLDMQVVKKLEIALNKKIKYNSTKDSIGYVLKVVKNEKM